MKINRKLSNRIFCTQKKETHTHTHQNRFNSNKVVKRALSSIFGSKYICLEFFFSVQSNTKRIEFCFQFASSYSISLNRTFNCHLILSHVRNNFKQRKKKIEKKKNITETDQSNSIVFYEVAWNWFDANFLQSKDCLRVTHIYNEFVYLPITYASQM